VWIEIVRAPHRGSASWQGFFRSELGAGVKISRLDGYYVLDGNFGNATLMCNGSDPLESFEAGDVEGGAAAETSIRARGKTEARSIMPGQRRRFWEIQAHSGNSRPGETVRWPRLRRHRHSWGDVPAARFQFGPAFASPPVCGKR